MHISKRQKKQVRPVPHDVDDMTTSQPSSSNDVLPPEILHEIFMTAQAAKAPNFPMIASHVCRSWRITALGASALWAHVSFNRNSRTFAWEQLQIERSKDACALLYIEISGVAFARSPERRARALLDLVRPEAGRLASLKVANIPHKALVALFSGLTLIASPHLHTFTVTQGPHIEFNPHVWQLDPFQLGAPKLREVTLRNLSFNAEAAMFRGLRKLVLDNRMGASRIGPLEVYHVMARCPDLEEFVLSNRNEPAGPEELPPPLDVPEITLEKLRKLLLESHYTFETLLQSVKFPALIHCPQKYTMPPYLFQLISKSNSLSSLQDLSVSGARYDETSTNQERLSHLPHLLEALPSLVDLKLTNFHVQHEWVYLLSNSFPQIKYLSLTYCDGLTGEDVKSLAQSRKARPDLQPLEALWVCGCDNLILDDECSSWLRENIARVILS